MRKRNRLILGVGIKDTDYVIQQTINGKLIMCKFYQTWHNMLERCYSPNQLARFPTYIGCSVCTEWLTFSNFKSWMETQDWEGKQLDKDLLISGNKIYSPTTCVFVDRMTNSFILGRGSIRGEWPIGVYFCKRVGKFKSQCQNPFTKKREHLGMFTCPEQAHLAWRKRKHDLALQLAELQRDERVAMALRSRYFDR